MRVPLQLCTHKNRSQKEIIQEKKLMVLFLFLEVETILFLIHSDQLYVFFISQVHNLSKYSQLL
jgi:hypothetical protein